MRAKVSALAVITAPVTDSFQARPVDANFIFPGFLCGSFEAEVYSRKMLSKSRVFSLICALRGGSGERRWQAGRQG